MRRTLALFIGIGLGFATGAGPARAVAPARPPGAELSPPGYDNTFAKDFIMDAPWRVIDAQTAIPLTIVLKDCDADDVRELHWIRCWDVTGGGATLLWDHNFGDECIGDDASEDNFWTYVTTVTEGHPALPNGTPLTPANLGYAAGAAIQLKVSIYYRDNWFNYTETRYLRVHVGTGPFPWPTDWYGGDVHYHTMYTNNIAEFGAPVPAARLTAAALGLHWLTLSDHSCDLDETGDGTYSYATHAWEYTLQTPGGTQTYYRDVFAYGSSWGGLGADVAEHDSPALRLYRATEINVASVDGDSWEKTLHALFYNPEYIASPWSGAFGERPVTPILPAGLDQLAPGGFAYAAHPMSDLGTEWGGIDWTVNGARWGDEDHATALERTAYRGLEAFNTRETRYATDANNPWGEFDAGAAPSNPYPGELLAGIALWDELLRAHLGETPRRILLAGGSDAHGDFNYATYLGLDNYATDNALGRVQTVVRVPGAYGPGNLPPMEAILAAYREGRSIVTDGPFLEIGVDRNGDGDWYDVGDLMVGGEGELDPSSCPPLQVRWSSLAEFGPVIEVQLWDGCAEATTLLATLDPTASGEQYGGTDAIGLAGLGLAGVHYLRAELRTEDGTSGHRAYTNPIWVHFAATTDVPLAEDGHTLGVQLAADPNPFMRATTIRCAAPPDRDDVALRILDLSGRCVTRIAVGTRQADGTLAFVWNGRDHAGRCVPAGIYTGCLQAGSARSLTRLVCVR